MFDVLLRVAHVSGTFFFDFLPLNLILISSGLFYLKNNLQSSCGDTYYRNSAVQLRTLNINKKNYGDVWI